MFKKIAILAALLAPAAFAANVYVGDGTVNSGSISTANVQGGSVAAFAGVSGTQAGAQTLSAGQSTLVVAPAGVQVTQSSGTQSLGDSSSFAFGGALAGSTFNAAGLSTSNGVGHFATIGVAP